MIWNLICNCHVENNDFAFLDLRHMIFLVLNIWYRGLEEKKMGQEEVHLSKLLWYVNTTIIGVKDVVNVLV